LLKGPCREGRHITTFVKSHEAGDQKPRKEETEKKGAVEKKAGELVGSATTMDVRNNAFNMQTRGWGEEGKGASSCSGEAIPFFLEGG